AWLTASPEHGRAFERVTDVWDSIDSAIVGGLPRLPREPVRQRQPRLNWTLAAAVIAALALGVYGMLRAPRYSTDIGEQRVVSLEDGTRVSLNSVTRIKVDYGARMRSVVLEEGEALFDVAHVPGRPFVVTAGDRKVTALGTRFLVQHDAQQTAV